LSRILGKQESRKGGSGMCEGTKHTLWKQEMQEFSVIQSDIWDTTCELNRMQWRNKRCQKLNARPFVTFLDSKCSFGTQRLWSTFQARLFTLFLDYAWL
jgi:hypothetical protein